MGVLRTTVFPAYRVHERPFKNRDQPIHIFGLSDNNINKSRHDCKLQLNNLNCGTLNVCGLRRKIIYPEFTEVVSQFDIFCVSETKLDDYDINLTYIFYRY